MPEILFILYKPGVPGNVGASARAIKTMGFSGLRLIQPCAYLNDEAMMLAHGSHDILESAETFESFEEAVKDLDLIICTTAKTRSAKFDYYSSRDLTGIINDKAESVERVGIIFGTEESGLPNSIIQQSDIAVTISMQTGYPSLNLSQSVMVIAYELTQLRTVSVSEQNRSAKAEGFYELKERTQLLLEKTGVPVGTPLHHRIMERVAMLKSTDIPLLHSVTSKVMSLLSSDSKNEADTT